MINRRSLLKVLGLAPAVAAVPVVAQAAIPVAELPIDPLVDYTGDYRIFYLHRLRARAYEELPDTASIHVARYIGAKLMEAKFGKRGEKLKKRRNITLVIDERFIKSSIAAYQVPLQAKYICDRIIYVDLNGKMTFLKDRHGSTEPYVRNG